MSGIELFDPLPELGPGVTEYVDRACTLLGLLLVRRLVRHAPYPEHIKVRVFNHVNHLIADMKNRTLVRYEDVAQDNDD